MGIDNTLKFIKEPLVDLGERMYLINCVSSLHCLGNDEDTVICRLKERLVDVINLDLLVSYESVSSLSEHTETLLDDLLEVSTERHDLTDRFHA